VVASKEYNNTKRNRFLPGAYLDNIGPRSCFVLDRHMDLLLMMYFEMFICQV
jgi:hypothetical protein